MNKEDKKLVKRINQFLAAKFKGCEVELDRVGPHLFGHISWSGFEGIDQTVRQKMVRKALEAFFTPSEYAQVGLLTFIPEELTVGHETF